MIISWLFGKCKMSTSTFGTPGTSDTSDKSSTSDTSDKSGTSDKFGTSYKSGTSDTSSTSTIKSNKRRPLDFKMLAYYILGIIITILLLYLLSLLSRYFTPLCNI